MNITSVRDRRQMLPRWRPFARTVAACELAMPSNTKGENGISDELKIRLETWRLERNIVSAAELVETALVENREDEATGAARILTAAESTATPLVRRQAALLLKRVGADGATSDPPIVIEVSAIAKARRRTRAFAHDPYAWADLALAYVNRGKDRDSKRAMQVALQLTPNDRHVLRSAARLFLHLDEPDRAYDLIRKSQLTSSDPWLMAAEVAIATRIERNPAFFKPGVKLIEDGGIHPRHFSELAGAIGTVHLWDGNRRARKFFLKSLLYPNGNALAQAEWASPHIGNLVIPQALARVEDSAEARAFQASWAAKFEEVIKCCEEWHEEEPFSSRPQQFGAHAANTIEKFELGLEFADAGLKANPNAPVLHNNRAFALGSLGRYSEAISALTYCLNKFPEESVAPLIATSGLIALRLGDFPEGRKRYREAIAIFKRLGDTAAEALCLAYFAQETARAGLPDAPKILQEARDACKRTHSLPEAEIVLRRAKAWQAAIEMRRQPNSIDLTKGVI